jgi:hypothetical protein
MAETFLPVAGITPGDLTSSFGAPRSGGRSHQGVDIFAKEGTAVVAAVGGTVVKAGDQGGLGGLRVWVRDDQGRFHYYAHLSAVNVKAGQRVEGGQLLGAVGNTGLEAQRTPHHLHYSVNPTGANSERGSFDPVAFLTGAAPVQAEDSFTAAARREQRSAVGVPELGPDSEFVSAATKFREGRQEQSQVFASIMETISRAASEAGGRVLDTRALFGDIFGENEPPEQIDEEVA